MTQLSRRAILAAAAGGALTSAAGMPVAADEPVAEKDKIKKTDAKYQDQPKGQQRCEICLQFQPPASCKIVQGPISPHGWCQFFAAKENAH
jgi:hypothetical protein